MKCLRPASWLGLMTLEPLVVAVATVSLLIRRFSAGWTVALPTFSTVGYGPAPMDYEVVKYEVAGGVATVTLNNPEKRNMLSGRMLAELVDAMKAARDSEDVRAVVLTGAGDKAFCAGADLGGFAADVPLVQKHFASDLFLEFFRLMPRLGKPSPRAPQRHGLGGGAGG